MEKTKTAMFNLKINELEVLRYLGYRNQKLDKELRDIILECRKEIKQFLNIKYTFSIFNIEKVENLIKVDNTNLLLKGTAINNHLKNSNKCAIMAVTLGNDIEKRIRYYQGRNLTKALILDACATTAVEEICDLVEDKVREIAVQEGRKINFRFSPGYGDLNLDIQSKLINILDANGKTGIMVSENNILFPRKSVTAIIGFIDKEQNVKRGSCRECNNYYRCNFKKEGEKCGN